MLREAVIKPGPLAVRQQKVFMKLEARVTD
jgi:hypothetical protein